ncbi:hypothetical protein CAPTEDRAFT_205277 [Capitella teleta]|uniref:Uncharacterized protein n=1 Tax=Capitella teleta TaxID=283909 RepID=R7VDA1_CAPTE|nr:hypothetical protein CAPTEDRAFT_205277 [Capitella teleta]|eukprot:ELU16808.1 hypothetical protein CAPTEDRAFT_205277 [Capitella teleta]
MTAIKYDKRAVDSLMTQCYMRTPREAMLLVSECHCVRNINQMVNEGSLKQSNRCTADYILRNFISTHRVCMTTGNHVNWPDEKWSSTKRKINAHHSLLFSNTFAFSILDNETENQASWLPFTMHELLSLDFRFIKCQMRCQQPTKVVQLMNIRLGPGNAGFEKGKEDCRGRREKVKLKMEEVDG